MKRLAVVLIAFLMWAAPGMLHASPWHKTQPEVAGHPHLRHYTQKAELHRVGKPARVRHSTRKVHVHKAARQAHRKHGKVGPRWIRSAKMPRTKPVFIHEVRG